MEPKFTVTSEWVDIWFSIQFKQFDEDDLDQPSNLVMYLTLDTFKLWPVWSGSSML